MWVLRVVRDRGSRCLAKAVVDSGWELIDADILGREVVDNDATIRERLTAVFGSDVILDDGSLDRRLIAQRAFASPEATKSLNAIIHPSLINKLISSIAAHDNAGHHCVVDCALIFEWGIETLFEIIVCVYAGQEIRKRRLMARDGRSEEEVEDMFAAQIPEIDKIRRSNIAVGNNGSVVFLKAMGRMIAELPDRLTSGDDGGH